MADNENKIKVIELGMFYYIHDGSKSGHPGLVVWKDDEANRYLVIRFDSDKQGDIPKIDRDIRHITKLKHTTDNNIINSYVRNRPMLCKRKDFGAIDFSNMSLHPDDIETINYISKKEPELSPSLKKKK